MSTAVDTILAFVSGSLSSAEFEERLSSDPSLESLLSEVPAPRYFQFGTTLYHLLIGLDYSDPSDLLDARGALSDYLKAQGLHFTASSAIEKRHDLLLSAQPRWLSADPKFIESLLVGAPSLPERQLKAWLRTRILEVFKCAGRPPRWIQSPAWPIGPNGPLVFLGQVPVPHYFHDDATVYVFHDPIQGTCEAIVQVA